MKTIVVYLIVCIIAVGCCTSPSYELLKLDAISCILRTEEIGPFQFEKKSLVQIIDELWKEANRVLSSKGESGVSVIVESLSEGEVESVYDLDVPRTTILCAFKKLGDTIGRLVVFDHGLIILKKCGNIGRNMAEVETCAALPSEEEGEDDLSAEITNRTSAGVVASTEYDALGRPVAQFDGRGNRTAYAYDARGRVVSATDAAGNVTKFGYDARGRRTSVTDPLGNAVATAYDSEGRVLSVRGAACPVDWGYDAWGDRVSMATYRDGSLAAGDVTRWLRDAATGLVTNRVSADGRRTAYAYDALGRPVRRTDARGISTDYAYDAAGDLAQVSHSDGTPSAAFARDRAGRLVAAVTDGVATNLFAYDAFGSVTNETQNGVAIERTYDNYGRLAAMDGAAYGYDALGRLASVEADGLSFTWLRVPGTDLPAGYVCGDFRRTVAYEPKRDLVAAVTNAFGDSVVSSFGYSNDAAGRRVVIRRGGSAFGDLAGSMDSYDYNARSEVALALREKDGSEVYGFLEDFAYDPIGNRTESAVYDENGTRYASVYETNGRNQYVSRTVPGLAAARGYADARATVTVNGNPAFRLGGYFFGTAAFDNTESGVDAEVETYAALPSDGEGGDDLVAAVTNRVHIPQTPETFAYDANGNQTLVETPSGRWAVEWNAENRPVRWTCGNRTLLMAYDHMGRRVRYVEMTGRITNKIATFLYDGHLCIARTENGTTDRFLWDPTEPVATRPLAMVADGTAYLYAHDANKNVSELVNARTGETAAHYDYSAFGKTLVATGPLRNRNPFRFSSEYVNDATGLSYYNWRHYDPVHGRWLSEDPIGEEGGLNVYGFGNNNLVNVFDQLGLAFSAGKYTFDEEKCVLNVELSWRVSYINKTNFEKWTSKKKDDWENKAKGAIQNYFNNLELKCYSENSGCCVCRNGVSVNFKLVIERRGGGHPGTRTDYYPKVITDGKSRSETIPGIREANLDIDDVLPQSKGAKNEQIPIIHEVGHQLGLPHPGGWGNDKKDYEADIESLMGGGMTMREADFSFVFCSKIKIRDKKKGKNCSKWKARK